MKNSGASAAPSKGAASASSAEQAAAFVEKAGMVLNAAQALVHLIDDLRQPASRHAAVAPNPVMQTGHAVPLTESTYAQPRPHAPASWYLRSPDAAPSPREAFEAQQTVQNTQLRTRSQIAAEKGLGDVKHLSAAKLAEYHFLDNAFKLHPFRLAGGLLKGGGAWSKIGKSYEAFAEEFGKTKDQFIAAKLTLLKDSARQLADGDPMKNVLTGKAGPEERDSPFEVEYVVPSDNGAPLGMVLTRQPRENEGGTDSRAQYVYSFGNGALTRLADHVRDDPSAILPALTAGVPSWQETNDYIRVPHPDATDGKADVIRARDVESRIKQHFDNRIEAYRAPLKEESGFESIITEVGEIGNGMAPLYNAAKSFKNGDIAGGVANLAFDAATILNPISKAGTGLAKGTTLSFADEAAGIARTILRNRVTSQLDVFSEGTKNLLGMKATSGRTATASGRAEDKERA